MSNMTHIADTVKVLAKQYAAVIEMGKFLDEAGALDNLKGELEAQIAKLRADAVTATEELQVAQQRVADAAHEAEDKLAAARDSAERIVATAKGDRAQIIGEAKTEADEIAAQSRALRAEAANAVANARTAVANLEAQMDAKKNELAKIEQAIAEARAKLGV